MTVEVRPADRADLDFIVDLFHDMLLGARRNYYFPRPTKGRSRDEAARYMGREYRLFRGSRGFVYVAEVGGKRAGFVSAQVKVDRAHYRTPLRTGVIQEIHVHPTFWRGGVGTALMRAAEQELARRGCRKTWVWSMAWSTPAHAFYRRQGYRVVYLQFEKRNRPTPHPRAPRSR